MTEDEYGLAGDLVRLRTAYSLLGDVDSGDKRLRLTALAALNEMETALVNAIELDESE